MDVIVIGNRRMFSCTVCETDTFIDLSKEAQLLYFHMGLQADDDGFVGSPKKIYRSIGVEKDCLEELVNTGYVIKFPSGVVVIRHWKVNNYIQNDRHHGTGFVDEMKQLSTDDSSRYFLCVSEMDTGCIQDVYKMDTEVNLSKDNSNKDNLSEDNSNKINQTKSTIGKGCGERDVPFGKSLPEIRLSDKEISELQKLLGGSYNDAINYVRDHKRKNPHDNKSDFQLMQDYSDQLELPF